MNSYGYQQYRQQSVNTMTQGELLILLYDEILKSLGVAEAALKSNQPDVFEIQVDKASKVIRHLNETLDKSYPISLEIAKLYDFFLYEIARIKIGRNIGVINEIKPLILELRNVFKEADRLSQVQLIKG